MTFPKANSCTLPQACSAAHHRQTVWMPRPLWGEHMKQTLKLRRQKVMADQKSHPIPSFVLEVESGVEQCCSWRTRRWLKLLLMLLCLNGTLLCGSSEVWAIPCVMKGLALTLPPGNVSVWCRISETCSFLYFCDCGSGHFSIPFPGQAT